MEISCIANVKAMLGEGPLWVAREQALYWVDIKGCKIFRLDTQEKVTQWDIPFPVSALATRKQGGFVAATGKGFALIDPEQGLYQPIGNPESDRPYNRFNDGKVDRQGRFWAGTMDDRELEATGALYRLDQNGQSTRIDDGYYITNGPAFSLDGTTFYHADSARQILYACTLDKDGAIAGKEVFARFDRDDGYPDGMTVDAEDCLWVAFWDGWCVRRFSPTGECIQRIGLPVQRPTSCTFGGPDFGRLYVTSASIGLDQSVFSMQPYAGGLFLLVPGVIGVAETPFAG